MRDIIKMSCANCNRANYVTTKNKRTMAEMGGAGGDLGTDSLELAADPLQARLVLIGRQVRRVRILE